MSARKRTPLEIGGVVRAMKGAMNIPGIRAYAEKAYASGGGR